MNVSYNAALSIICAALGWSIEKAKHVMKTDSGWVEPKNREEPYVPATRLGEFIKTNYGDRNNHEY